MHFYLINKINFWSSNLLLTISTVRIMKIEFIILRDKSSTMSSIGHLLILTTDDVVAQIFLATFKGSRPGCWGPLHCKYFAAMHGDFAIFCSCLDVTAQTATSRQLMKGFVIKQIKGSVKCWLFTKILPSYQSILFIQHLSQKPGVFTKIFGFFKLIFFITTYFSATARQPKRATLFPLISSIFLHFI